MNTLPGPAEPLDISFNEDALDTLTAAFTRYGDAFSIFSPEINARICVFSHPDHVRQVFVDNHANYTKGIGIERVRILLGNGIMASEGEMWRRQRKMIQPAFHRNVIARMFTHIRNGNVELRDKWLSCAREGREINLTQDLSDVTLNIVVNAIFGDDMAAISASDGRHPFALLTEDSERNLQFAYKFRALSKLVIECVNRRREGELGNDLLGMLLAGRDRRTNDAMSDKLLIDEVLTLVVAGHEATASALNWFWYLLAHHPQVEQRLHDEVDRWNEDGADINSVTQLTYTRQVLDETMRLYPPGWLLTRRSIGADTVGGHPIAANTDVFLSPYLIHRHPAFWETPDAFDPDRFAQAQAAQRNRFCYLPFALGPRACIGEQFAVIEMAAHAALLARKLRLRYLRPEPVTMECQVNLRPKQNIFMQVEERK